MKKIWIVFLALAIIAFVQTESFAQTEIQIRDQTLHLLGSLYMAQMTYSSVFAEAWPHTVLCPNYVCWQGKTLSSLNVPGSSLKDLVENIPMSPHNCPQFPFSPDIGSQGGDVRFRCRRQGVGPTDIWCFAYRCQEASPSGCRQLWRLRFKLRQGGGTVPVDCFDLQNTGVCNEPLSVSQVFENCL